MIRRLFAAALWAALPLMASAASAAGVQTAPSEANGVRVLLSRLEEAVHSGNNAAYLALLSESADRARAADFAGYDFPKAPTKVTIQERDRQDLPGAAPGQGFRIVVDAFMEEGDRASISTWQLDIRADPAGDWWIEEQEKLSGVESLYRLAVNKTHEFSAHNLNISAEDLDLTLVDGSVFTIDTDRGVTGLVLVGRGDMRFHPTPDSEKTQVRIFSGSETLETRFDAAYIRVGDLAAHLDRTLLVEEPVDERKLKRAEQIFREESAKSYTLDLADLTSDSWSMMLSRVDFVAEIRTRRFETLTYARASSEAEDISLFDRRRQRNISLYASPAKLAERGAFYDDAYRATYDVVDYSIDVSFSPTRQWIDGVARLRVRVGAKAISDVTLHLADSLTVHSIVADRLGRLFFLRAKGQNTVLVNLPATVVGGTEMTLTVRYAGHLEPQPSDREALLLQEQGNSQDTTSGVTLDMFAPRAEPNFLYSNRAFWYPQPPAQGFATATLHVTVPADYACIATGEPTATSPLVIAARDSLPSIKIFMFTAPKPVRYLAFVVSRLAPVNRSTLSFEPGRLVGAERAATTINLAVHATPQVLSHGNEIAARLTDIERFYYSVIGDTPYSTFTLAALESILPGGHSPAYFGVLDEPLPSVQNVWRSDPASFPGFPEFFLAHEVAHQWWGGAVGWRNYHEQWLSEGFAQYFAALYAKERRGDTVFAEILRKMRKSAMDESDQGPIYLGYRVGHIRNDGRVFRSVVYNKAAVVLHMLRRFLGDDVFFRGIQNFYDGAKFSKVGTEDFRMAMEAVSDVPLQSFFERWIYGSTLPRVTFTYRVDTTARGEEAVLHFEQTGEVFQFPVTVTLRYADKKPVDVIVRISDRNVDERVPLVGKLRSIEVNKDDGTLADVKKGP